MQKEIQVSSYEAFLKDNRKKINEQFNMILRACIAAGPLIAVAVKFNLFLGVTYKTAILVSVFMLALAIIHKLLLSKFPDSIVTSMIALFAIDVLLIVMDSAHLTIFITWFLIPLLSLQFCDYKLYSISVIVNYFFMVFATWHMAPYFTERRTDMATPMAYFLSRLGGLTIEMIMMIAAGYSLCRLTMRYYKTLIEQTDRMDEERKLRERLTAQLSSLADICMYACEIDLTDSSFYEFRTGDIPYEEIDTGRQENVRLRFKAHINEYVAEKFRDDMYKFTDLYTIDSRMKDGKSISLEYPDAMGRWVRARFIVAGRYEDGRINRLIYLVEDIHEEKNARDELIDISQRAIAASEAKSAFLSNMSHEIRTPINTVLGMNEMILRESSENEILTYSENIRNAGHSLLGIVNDILDFSKIEAGKMEIVPVEYDISSVLNDLVNMVRIKAEEKGLGIKLNFDRNMPKILYGDEVRLKQIITNILSNAVKYTEKGSILFKIGFEKDYIEDNSIFLNVAIQDTGIGIRPEDMKRLFSEFERIEEKRNRNIEGTGLGMNITESLLELMGSSLDVESEYGHGSRFSFSLKQKVVRWEALGDYETAFREHVEDHSNYKEKLLAPKARILVVDDNYMNLVVFKNLLKLTQMRIDAAQSGNEGIEMSKERQYDIIFLDHMMPDKDGIETLHEIREEMSNPNMNTPMICLTANALSGAKEQYLSEGFNDYISKPVDSARLEELIIKYLPEDKVSFAAGDPGKPEAEADPGADAKELPQELDALKGQNLIDVAEGLNCSGSLEGYLPLLKIFYESLEEKLSEIEGYYQSDDIENYTIKVHALKSSAKLIGATALGEQAQELEDAGKAKDVDYIFDNHEKFVEDCRSHGEVLKPMFDKEQEPTEDLPLADEEVMKELREEFRKAADAMDCDGLDEVIEKSRSYSFTSQDKELIQKLKEAADRFDYDEVLNLLK